MKQPPIFPDWLPVPKTHAKRLLESTQHHWHELPDDARDLLTSIVTGSSLPCFESARALAMSPNDTPATRLVKTAWSKLLPYRSELEAQRVNVSKYKKLWVPSSRKALDDLERL